MAQLLKLEDFVWTTGMFCQRNRIPHDAALLIKQYPSPYEVVNLPQVLQCFGLNNSLKQSSIAQLTNVNLHKTQKAYLWAYCSNALTAEPPMLVFDYQPGRHGIHVRNFLADWQGHLMVDDYVLRTRAR